VTTYALTVGRYTDGPTLQKAVGQQYHLGLSTTLPDATQRFYGYLLEPNIAKDGGFHQRSDVAGRDALVQTASPNLIDRLMAFFPRVTDGDFSSGGFQEVWIDPKRYFDSDLDPRIPGYLQLRASWARISKAGLTVGTNFQVVAWKGDFWYTFAEASGNIYSANGATTTTPTAVAILSVDTDGSLLYAGTAGGLWSTPDGITWTALTSSINGTATQWWVVNQGTNGFFAYYRSGPNLLYKIDLTQTPPQAAGAQPQVPLGGNAVNLIDLVEYQTSIAILTTDVRGPGSDVWYFDGNNLTRIVRIEGYTAQGMCQALGSLYVSAFPVGQVTSPILASIFSGQFQIVVRPGSPFFTANQSCLQPRAASQYVYWPIINPSINGISTGKGAVIQYDVVSGATTKLPNMDATDFTTTGGTLRAIGLLGDNVACCYVNGTTGILQYQQPAFGTIKYMTSGWVASSHIDFSTPGIQKRFRRIEVSHAPLNAGEQLLVEAFVDTDPLAFSTGLTPVPSGATVTNSTVGSALTAMTFGQDTIGKTLYFALKLTSGTGQLTTPRVSYVSIEIGGTWTWPMRLTCTSKRGLLDGQNDDQQGVTGKDLAYLLILAYENGQNMTLYHRNGQSYTVAIETLDAWNPSPLQPAQPQLMRDEEYIVDVTFRQVA
jgi:hypothetical protein